MCQSAYVSTSVGALAIARNELEVPYSKELCIVNKLIPDVTMTCLIRHRILDETLPKSRLNTREGKAQVQTLG